MIGRIIMISRIIMIIRIMMIDDHLEHHDLKYHH